MEFLYNDGGRSDYFRASDVKDCVTRALAIATGNDYKAIYDELNLLAKSERRGCKKRKISDSRSGVYRVTYDKYLVSHGWRWRPVMTIGGGCKLRLNEIELESYGLMSGTYILRLSKHLTVIRDGVINDTYDPSRDGSRCVYGYYYKSASFEDRRVRDEIRGRV